MNNVIVSKFGGSITANADGVKRAAQIISSDPARRYVVASAPGGNAKETGVTDMLFMCHYSFINGENYNAMLNDISKVYRNIIDALGMKFDLDSEINSLRNLLLSGCELPYIGSRGEYILGKILAQYLGWEFVDASELIFFNEDGSLNETKTFTTAHEKLSCLERAVIPGFYGSMPDGKIKTFPRGDGDSSGAIIARSVNADLFEKWSETVKIYSADPSVVKGPKRVRSMTYGEAVALNYTGLNSIKDSVLFMMSEADIPIRICGLGDEEGMLISSKPIENTRKNTAVCIAGRRNFGVIHIEKYGVNKMQGFGEKLFGIFAKHRIACEHCLSGIHKMSIVLKSQMFELRKNDVLSEIKEAFNPDSITLGNGLSLIAVIGEGMGSTHGIFERVFASLSGAGVKVRMTDQGSDDLNIMLGVNDEDYERAVRALYEGMIEAK